ncbi:two-component sensor histidine kinase [Desulfococcaceae bacterium OttesenSCG-928-F15]|nr:two-component sensor histidine kinase [Desulfococcaceae bacterium OttesenSCG-928-F15]
MKRNYRKLWWQHFLAIICFSVIPMLFVNLSLYVISDRIYTDKVTESVYSAAENRSDAIALFINERIAQLFTIANTNTFEELTNEDYLNKVFNIMHARSDSYMDIGIIDDKGNHVAYVGPYYSLLKPVNYRNEDWFAAVHANGLYLSDIFLGFRQVPHFIVAVLVRERNTSWIVRVTINLKNIDDIVQKAWRYKGSDAFLINRANILQTTPRFGGKVMETAPGPDFSSIVHPMMNRMLHGGRDSFYAVSPVPGTKWILVTTEHASVMLSPLQKGLYWFLALTVLGLIVIATGTALFTNAIVHRIIRSDRENANNFDMLMQANKMVALSKMAAGIAHEVNNPLASIAEKAGWMKDLLEEEDIRSSKSFKEFDESIDKIEQHVARARKVIHNLLGFARRMEPAKEKINVNNLLDETTGFLENEARYVNVSFEKNYEDNVPIITSDLSQIQQVVLNLLNNAIDAIGKDGIITVGSRYMEKTDEVAISIADNGPGIVEAELKRIFDPFFTTKEVGKGTGLGLSISYSIIEKLGGKIQVKSKVGQGTVFTIILPKN